MGMRYAFTMICIELLLGCSGHRPIDAGFPTSLETLPVIEVGEPSTLLENGQLGLKYFPDEGTSLIRKAATLTLMLTANDSSYLVTGTDLKHLSQATRVLEPGAAGDFDNGYAGISAVVQLGSTYYGFYHAEDREDLPALPGNIPGFYASVALARSDDGVVWRKVGQVITSSQPKSYTAYPNQGDRGAGEPGAIVSRDGHYVYLYYTEHSRLNGRGVDVCVARADLEKGPPLPGSFHKYHKGTFFEPGLGGRDTPVITGKGFSSANALEGHVTYSNKVGRYLIVFGIDSYQERMAGLAPAHSGIYSAWSKDGISWSAPKQLVADQAVPQTGMSVSWEASIIFDDATGAEGTLVYGHSPKWGEGPHFMAGRRIRITQ